MNIMDKFINELDKMILRDEASHPGTGILERYSSVNDSWVLVWSIFWSLNMVGGMGFRRNSVKKEAEYSDTLRLKVKKNRSVARYEFDPTKKRCHVLHLNPGWRTFE